MLITELMVMSPLFEETNIRSICHVNLPSPEYLAQRWRSALSSSLSRPRPWRSIRSQSKALKGSRGDDSQRIKGGWRWLGEVGSNRDTCISTRSRESTHLLFKLLLLVDSNPRLSVLPGPRPSQSHACSMSRYCPPILLLV